MVSSSICFPANVMFYYFLWLNKIVLCICSTLSLSTQLLIDIRLFPFFNIINTIAVNIHVQLSWCCADSPVDVYILRSDITGPYGQSSLSQDTRKDPISNLLPPDMPHKFPELPKIIPPLGTKHSKYELLVWFWVG